MMLPCGRAVRFDRDKRGVASAAAATLPAVLALLKPWIMYTNLKVQKSLLHRLIEMETFVFRVESLYLSGVF
jgi:hypothetical protein